MTISIPGGILLAMIEGIGIAMTRFSAEQFNPGMLCFHTVAVLKQNITGYIG